VGDTQRPLEYLVASSQSSVESYLVSRLTRLAELRQRIHELVNEWVQIQGDERAARWLLKSRDTGALPVGSAGSPSRALSFLDLETSLSCLTEKKTVHALPVRDPSRREACTTTLDSRN